jgi:hypothetical protein
VPPPNPGESYRLGFPFGPMSTCTSTPKFRDIFILTFQSRPPSWQSPSDQLHSRLAEPSDHRTEVNSYGPSWAAPITLLGLTALSSEAGDGQAGGRDQWRPTCPRASHPEPSPFILSAVRAIS